MNYHRRTTRPDGMHYRETRKYVGASRGGRRRGRGGIHPVVLVIAVVVVAAIVVWLFRR